LNGGLGQATCRLFFDLLMPIFGLLSDSRGPGHEVLVRLHDARVNGRLDTLD
jgi:hypothetical protein